MRVTGLDCAAVGATQYVRTFNPSNLEGFDAANFVLQGLYVAQIALGALGVLTVTGEYATGMIRTTLTAVPQRRVVVALKGLVYRGRVALGSRCAARRGRRRSVPRVGQPARVCPRHAGAQNGRGLGMLTVYGLVILLGALFLLGRRDA